MGIVQNQGPATRNWSMKGDFFRTLRLPMIYVDEVARCGNISNWALLEIAGALYFACVLQDMKMANCFLYGAGGMTDQLGKGTLSDGWWYEASIGYNLLAAGNFSMMAQVLLHFGIDIRYMNVPAGYSKTIDARKVLRDRLVIEDWSQNTKKYRNISMLWVSLINFYDYRGVIFGIKQIEVLLSSQNLFKRAVRLLVFQLLVRQSQFEIDEK